MWTQREWIEHINQVDDPRNQDYSDALERDEILMRVTWRRDRAIRDDERDLPAIIALGDVDEIEEVTVFPATFVVCELCNGKGSHVNPSIDAGGISFDDEFWADDYDDNYDDEADYDLDGDCDEADALRKEIATSRYRRGDYDVPCVCCAGKRVVLQIDRSASERAGLGAALKAWDEHLEEEAEYAAERRAERRMGC